MTNRADLHHAIIDILDDGGTVPCVGDSRWVSPLRQHIEEAMEACRSCPVISMCREYSVSAGENAGVWGGKRREGLSIFRTAGGTHYLTDDQKQAIDVLLDEKVPMTEIAKQVGVTYNQVMHRRHRRSA